MENPICWDRYTQKISLTRCLSSSQKDFTDILHYPVGEVGSVCTSLHEPTAQICLWCSGSLKHTIFHFSLFLFSKSLASASQSCHSRHFTSLWASMAVCLALSAAVSFTSLPSLFKPLYAPRCLDAETISRESISECLPQKSVRNRWERDSRESRPNAKEKGVHINHDQQHHLVASHTFVLGCSTWYIFTVLYLSSDYTKDVK